MQSLSALPKKTRKELIKQGLAQKIVSVGFSDKYVFNPPEFKVSCDHLEDLQDCAEIIGKYNEFDPEKIKAASPLFMDLYDRMTTFSIGRENGPVLYISAYAMDPQGLKSVLKFLSRNSSKGYSSEDQERLKNEFKEFKKKCRRIAKVLLATECHFYYKESPRKVCRIWWD